MIEKNSEDGVREAICTLKKDVENLFSRVHGIEMGGCPKGIACEKEIKEMKEDIKMITRELYKTSAVLAGILIAAQLMIKFL